MKVAPLETLDVDALVKHFVSIAIEQDEAIFKDDNRTYNRLYNEMEAVEAELKQRDGDQRRALLPLLRHWHPQVRLKAAIAVLAIEPEVGRQTLQKISDADQYPQAADARSMMNALDEGRYVPS